MHLQADPDVHVDPASVEGPVTRQYIAFSSALAHDDVEAVDLHRCVVPQRHKCIEEDRSILAATLTPWLAEQGKRIVVDVTLVRPAGDCGNGGQSIGASSVFDIHRKRPALTTPVEASCSVRLLGKGRRLHVVEEEDLSSVKFPHAIMSGFTARNLKFHCSAANPRKGVGIASYPDDRLHTASLAMASRTTVDGRIAAATHPARH